MKRQKGPRNPLMDDFDKCVMTNKIQDSTGLTRKSQVSPSCC